MDRSQAAQGNAESPQGRRIWGLSRNVFFLGIVSFFTDVSSDMIFGPLFPLFLSNVLKSPVAIIGLITGLSEGFESILKISSGWISDHMRKRKIIAVMGYGLSSLSKPFLYWANIWAHALGVRFVDRVGKAVRTPPRDALIADSVSKNERGKNFGLHSAMDTAGAMVGLAVAALVIFLIQRGSTVLDGGAYRKLVLIALVPAFLAVLVLVIFVREARGDRATEDEEQEVSERCVGEGFSLKFKIFLVVMVLFTLGNSSDAFLSLRAQNLGYDIVQIVLMFLVLATTHVLSSTSAGALSDRVGRKKVILTGWVFYALVYLGFAMMSSGSGQWQIWTLFAVYGLYYGLTTGAAKSYVADMVPRERCGTAYGLYHGTVGFSLLGASLIAGGLWESVNPAAPFFFGAGLAGVAAISLVALVR